MKGFGIPRAIGKSSSPGLLVLLAAFSVFWAASLFLYHFPPQGLVCWYYENEKAEGFPRLMLKTPRVDLRDVIGKRWGQGPSFEHVSVVWSGWIRIESAGVRRFVTHADDDSAILIDEQIVVAGGQDPTAGERSGEVFLSKGMHRFKVTYFNASGAGFLRVAWDDAKGNQVSIKPHFLFPSRYSPVLNAIPRDPRIIFWFYPALWGLLFIGVQKKERRAVVAKGVLATLGLCLLAGVLMQLRYVCLPGEKGQTLLIYSYCFFLSLPCVYILCKLLFPAVIRVFLVTFYALLALFPYKYLFAEGTDLCRIFSYPPTPTRFGLERYWVLVLYVLLACAVAAVWQRRNRLRLAGTTRGIDLAVCALCLIAVILQIAPRLDTNSPRMVQAGLHDGTKVCGTGCTADFYGHCVMCDVPHHTVTNGILKGVKSDDYRGLVTNRRLLSSYLYSLFEPFTHPYYAAILVNGLFLYLLAIAGYALARHLALPRAVTVVFPLLLTGNYLFLFEAVDTSFYVQKSAFALFVLTAGCLLDVYGRQASPLNRALFCSILACSSLVYDPFLLVGFVFLWGLYLAIRQVATDHKSALGTLLLAIGFAIVPILSQVGLENLLYTFGLEGNQDNSYVRDIMFKKLPLLPGYVIHHFKEFITRCNTEFVRMFLGNPVAAEFLSIMGIFGLYCFAALLPKYVKRDHLVPLYAIYASCMIFAIAGAITAYMPPVSGYAFVYTDLLRSTVYYPVIVLSQGIGIHHFTAQVSSRLFPATSGDYLAYVIAGCVWLGSFYQIVP